MSGRLSPGSVSTKLQRIAELPRTAPSLVLTTLAHHIDKEWMHEAWRRTRRDAAPGIDGTTAEEYAKQLNRSVAVSSETVGTMVSLVA